MISIIITVVLVALMQLLVPAWWWIMMVPFVAGFLNSGFVWRTVTGHAGGIALLWMSVSLFQWISAGDRIVSRIQTLMGLPSSWLLVLVTTLLAFLVAALATYCGMALRRLVIQEKQIS